MVTKNKTGEKKGKIKVDKLKLNKETVKELSGDQKEKVKGGARPRGGDDTKLIGTCTFIQACR